MDAPVPQLWLFLIFLGVGFLSFGGAYSIWGLIHQIFVQPDGKGILGSLPVLPAESFYSYMEVGQLTPGPNINGVLLVGHYYSGYSGMGIVLMGLLLPSVIAMILLYRLNQKYGLNRFFSLFKAGALAAVIGVLIYLLVKLSVKIPQASTIRTMLFIAQVFVVLYFVHHRRTNVILIAFLSGLLTWAYSYFFTDVL